MLGPPSKLDCLMLTPPMRLVRKKPTTLILMVCFFAAAVILEFFYSFPYIRVGWIGFNLTLTLITAVSLFLACYKDPGFIR